MNNDVDRVKIDQQRLDHELDFIESQQRELEEMLQPLETSVNELPPINYQQHADVEREHTYVITCEKYQIALCVADSDLIALFCFHSYQLAENVDAQLKSMVQDLKHIIDHLNSTNQSQDPQDPVCNRLRV